MKIETFEIILEAAIDGIKKNSDYDPDPEQVQAIEEADKLWDLALERKAEGKTEVAFQFRNTRTLADVQM